MKKSITLIALIAMSQASGRTISEQVMHRAEVVKVITKVAARVGVPRELMLAVAWVESSHRANLPPSLDGATPSYGLFQIKLETAQWVDEVYKHKYRVTPERLSKVEFNTFYACKFMKLLLKRYKGDWAKAATAYNKGHATTGSSIYWRKVSAVLSMP